MSDAESTSPPGDSFRSVMFAGAICAAVSTLLIRIILTVTGKGESGNDIQEGWRFQLAAASQFVSPVLLTLWFIRREISHRPLLIIAGVVIAVSSQACGAAMILLNVSGTALIFLQHLRPLVWIGLLALFLCRLKGVRIRWMRFVHLVAVVPLAWTSMNVVFYWVEVKAGLHYTTDNNTWCLIAAPLLWYQLTSLPLPFAWQPTEDFTQQTEHPIRSGTHDE